MIRSSLSLVAALAVVGCSNPELESKVAELEKKVTELEGKAGAGGATANNARPQANEPSPEDKEALELYKKANQAFQAGNTDEAKQLIAEIGEKYPTSRAKTAADRLLDQISIVGKPISELEVESWLSDNKVDLDDGKATLVVFWEVWCPHCQREVPKLQATYEKYKPQGLNVVGLTKINRGKTPEDVKAFMAEHKVTYPVGKEDGDMSTFFGVQGVPAAAVVKDGKVVWRGHPATLNDQMLEGWL